MPKILYSIIFTVVLILAVGCGKTQNESFELVNGINVYDIADNQISIFVNDNTSISIDSNSDKPIEIKLKNGYQPQNNEIFITGDKINIRSFNEGTEDIPLVILYDNKITSDYTLKVISSLRDLEICYHTSESLVEISSDEYSIELGSREATIDLETDEYTELSIATYGDSINIISTEKSRVVFEPKQIGKTTLLIEGKNKYYNDCKKEIIINCNKPKLNGRLELEEFYDEGIEVGNSFIIKAHFDYPDIAMSVTADDRTEVYKYDNLTANVTAYGVGHHKIYITVSADGYENFNETIEYEVVPQKTPLDVEATEITLPFSLTKSIDVLVDEATSVEVIYNTDMLKCEYYSNKLYMTAKTTGITEVTLIAHKDEYDDSYRKINVKIVDNSKRLKLGKYKTALKYGETDIISILDVESDDEIEVYTSENIIANIIDNEVELTLIDGDIESVNIYLYKANGDVISGKVTVLLREERIAANERYYRVLDSVNDFREQNGLNKLVYRQDIQLMADIRAREIVELWEHARPGNKTWDSVFAENGVEYYTEVGENLAKGNTLGNPQRVVTEWMNSPDHRDNILAPEFTGMAVSCYYYDGCYYWAQMFIVD